VTHGQCDARPTVTFPAAKRHRPLTTGTKLHCLLNTGTCVWTTCPRSLPGSAPSWNRSGYLLGVTSSTRYRYISKPHHKGRPKTWRAYIPTSKSPLVHLVQNQGSRPLSMTQTDRPRYDNICSYNYTVDHKKRVTLLLSISLPITDRFSQFFYWRTLRTICNKAIIMYPTTR